MSSEKRRISSIMPGIIAADIVGGSRKDNPSGQALRRELASSLRRAAPPHSDLQDTDFGIRLVLSDARDAYDILRMLVSDWMRVKSGAASPLILGLKIGLHAGRNLTGSSEKFMGLNSDGKAFRLAWAGNSDAVRMSTRMYNLLEDRILGDRIIGIRKSFDLDYEYSLDGVEIPITALLPANQFRISIAPPEELMLYLARNPEFTRVLEPEAFERVIGRLFEDAEYQVELTKRTRDGGIDLIALREKRGLDLDQRFLIQCKRYAETHRVGVEAVRELAGVGSVEPNSGLVLVTTSSFAAPAIEFARQPVWAWRLYLRDYLALQRWLTEYAHRRNVRV